MFEPDVFQVDDHAGVPEQEPLEVRVPFFRVDNAQGAAVAAVHKGAAAAFDIGVVHLHQAVAARSYSQPGQIVVRVVGADQGKHPVNGKVPADLVQAVLI